VHHFSGVKECLRRHAAAQDAKASQLARAVDHRCLESGRSCGAGSSITAAATAYYRDVKVIVLIHVGTIDDATGSYNGSEKGRATCASV
jgi:hypothetical protein